MPNAPNVLAEVRQLIADSRRWRAEELQSNLGALNAAIQLAEEVGAPASEIGQMRSYIFTLTSQFIESAAPKRKRTWLGRQRSQTDQLAAGVQADVPVHRNQLRLLHPPAAGHGEAAREL